MNWDEFYKSLQEAYHIEDEATVIKIPFENIIEITSEELIFKNNDGKTEKIDLGAKRDYPVMIIPCNEKHKIYRRSGPYAPSQDANMMLLYCVSQ